MKTMGERAKEFATERNGKYSLQQSEEQRIIWVEDYNTYVNVATEQKAIDIEKACEWLEGYMERLGYIDDWCRQGEDKFRKAIDSDQTK